MARTWRPMKPNSMPVATCSVCGHGYPTRTPDAGCYSAHAIPVATLGVEGKCETCIRRGVSASTAGAVNKREG